MTAKLLTEHHLDFLSLIGGSSESTLVKKPSCWKSHVAAKIVFNMPRETSLKGKSYLPVRVTSFI